MSTVKDGDTIVIHYTGKLEDGTVFDSSEGGNPLEFKVGDGELIPGLEQGVIGMAGGETKVITIPAELGYGPREEERVFEFSKDKIGANIDLEIGQQVQMFRADGMPIMATIIGKSETSYAMDCNHPLAGKTLIFETRLLEIR
ncbi:MAG: peptidylprolyl isomerase [Nitrospirae bacterium]|nr:peptidylprolyl isomerase [Nitrospirota bacterium]MCL5978221.1 peptidylprolyl isomerase [Nitrospirota bacterium]